MSLSRKALLIVTSLAAAVFSASCSYTGGDLPALYEVGKSLWAGPKNITFDDAAAVPYASVGVRLGSRGQIMLVLATETDGLLMWTSDAKISILTRDGRIVRTAGLGRDLSAYSYKMVSTASGTTVAWQADFKDMNLAQIPGTCERSQPRDETILILGKSIRTRRIDERCRAQGHELSWSFTNTFWIDPDSGMVWRSIQHIHPQMPSLEIVTLRPAASPPR